MIRILITAGTLGMGGLENQLVYLGKHIDHSRFQVDYTSTDENAFYKKDIVNAGCGFYVLPDPRKDGTIPYCIALLRLLRQNRYDVVHAQELFHSGIEMVLAWAVGVKKRIAHSHSTLDGSSHNSAFKTLYHWGMRKCILLFATNYLACSTFAGEYLYGKEIVNDPRFRVVFNSVETERFLGNYHSPVIPRKEGWKYITHVGRFVDVKNHDFMIDLAAWIKLQNLKIAFVFVGNGELLEKCRNRVHADGLEEYVLFMGQRRDVPEILLDSDAFILPSHYEGMPLSVIEAQAAGLPCVIADHITDELDFGLGLLRKKSLAADKAAWTQAIQAAVSQPHPDQERISRAIHRMGFDVADFQQNLCEIYRG